MLKHRTSPFWILGHTNQLFNQFNHGKLFASPWRSLCSSKFPGHHSPFPGLGRDGDDYSEARLHWCHPPGTRPGRQEPGLVKMTGFGTHGTDDFCGTWLHKHKLLKNNYETYEEFYGLSRNGDVMVMWPAILVFLFWYDMIEHLGIYTG